MASFQISPGVQIKEADYSAIIPAVPVNIGAIVGDFQWGPCNEITQVSSEQELVARFGEPVDRNAKVWFVARNYLAYSQNMKVIRVMDNTLSGANAYDKHDAPVAGGAGFQIMNDTDFENQRATLSAAVSDPGGAKVAVWAKYPGAFGNRIGYAYTDAAGFTSSGSANIKFDDYFEYAPTDTEIAVLVYLDGNVVERFMCSAIQGALDGNNEPYYIESVINRSSRYINIIADNLLIYTDATKTVLDTGNSSADAVLQLAYGADVAPADDTESAILEGWQIFAAAEDIDINFCMLGDDDPTGDISKFIVQNVCEERKDCIAFLSPPQDQVVNVATPTTNIVDYRKNTANINSSYGVMDGNYKYQYDYYNEKYRWVPFCGDTAGLMARTSYNQDPWWSPAGLNRGQLKNTTKLAFNPAKANRDSLYKNGINPIVSFPGEGIVLYGDKTMQGKASAFDRINVRMLFIILEKAIAKAAKYMLFEFNDEFTRTRFVQMVEPFLRDVQGRRGIQRYKGKDGFYVIADERVNTPEVIDSNEFRATILIKPNRSINFIELTFAATRTGVEFEELANEITGNATGSGTLQS